MRLSLFRPRAWSLLFPIAFLAGLAPAAATGDPRLALVIGNSRYTHSPLANPANDAEDMAAALKSTGFQVILKTDASQRTMERAIQNFGRRLRGGGVGLFYYAGHGLQIDGRNHLIPVDAEIESESDVKYEAVDAGRVLGKMEDAGNGLNIVILDACRDNPFARSFRSGQKGLAKMDAPVGSLLAYATAPGSVAADGTGRNGLYTSKLLKFIHTPGMKIEDMFKQVRREVMAESGKKQVPWESSSMAGDFYFTPAATPKQTAAEPTFEAPSENLQARLAALEAEKAQLKAENQLILEKQRIETERLRLDKEKKLFAEKLRLDAEKRQLEKEKAELAAAQAKIKTDQAKKTGPDPPNAVAYAPSSKAPQDMGSGYRIALFPEHAKVDPNHPYATSYEQLRISLITKATFAETLDALSGRQDIRLTDSAIPQGRLSPKTKEFQDLRFVIDQLGKEGLKALWHRPSAFSRIEPNVDQAVALGKRIGVDLVLMHRMVRHVKQNEITVYLIDIRRKEVYKKHILTSTSRSVQRVTKSLLQIFLEKHPLSPTRPG